MNTAVDSVAIPSPVRASLSDSPLDILKFAVSAFHQGGVALATLVEIRGGAARPLGSQLAVAWDGRFYGYVSGGCVEAAVAAESLAAIAAGRDRLVKFGEGSPFFDIVLPCGGGITVAIHLLRDIEPLRRIIRSIERREPATMIYDSRLEALAVAETSMRTAWTDSTGRIAYFPPTRLIISGQSSETTVLERLAKVSGYDVVSLQTSDLCQMHDKIDAFTAVALLHHDLDAEIDILEAALYSKAFYIGALGSTRTHSRRIERLRAVGVSRILSNKIKAPTGMFGPTRCANSLAISVLADVAAARLASYP